MKQYLEVMRKIRDHGADERNTRTGKMCRFIVGEQMRFDLADGFPAMTTKRLAFKAVKGELLGFFRGYDNAAQFRALGCNVWNANANDTRAWLDNPTRKGVDDLGTIYGVNWTSWKDQKIVPAIERGVFEELGYKYLGTGLARACESDGGPHIEVALMERRINQLEKALHTIMANPSDRRIIITGWNPATLDQCALPACHMDYKFVPVQSTRTLHVVMTIRSWDFFLGAPFNIASTALLLEIMARLSGYTAGTVTIQATNVHLYEDHMSQVEEQLNRVPHRLPNLQLSGNITQVLSPADAAGVFTRITPEDIWLEDYECQAAIDAPMAA